MKRFENVPLSMNDWMTNVIPINPIFMTKCHGPTCNNSNQIIFDNFAIQKIFIKLLRVFHLVHCLDSLKRYTAKQTLSAPSIIEMIWDDGIWKTIHYIALLLCCKNIIKVCSLFDQTVYLYETLGDYFGASISAHC